MAHRVCGPGMNAPSTSANRCNLSDFQVKFLHQLQHRTRQPPDRVVTVLHGLTKLTSTRHVSAKHRYSSRLQAIAASSTQQKSRDAGSTDQDDFDQTLAVAADEESRQILEWPAVCKQVACFCGTSFAADMVARGYLPRGRSREESELLLQQTAEALAANLEVKGCFDILPAVTAAAAGVSLTAKQFEGVASTLEAAFALKARVLEPQQQQQQQPAEGPSGQRGGPGRSSAAPRPAFPALAQLAEGISDEERTLLRAIRECIKLGTVADAASEALAAVRAERQANKERLRAEVDGWARQLQAKGAAEVGGVSLVRGRFCVGVRAGRQGELPKGSVRLSASSTGATLYMEPKPAIELNNQEALLAEREEAEVARVLGLLSRMLGTRETEVLDLVDAIRDLDVVAARAKHARWLGAVRPAFVDPRRGDSESSPLLVPGALHPVLMQRALPPLPQPPSVDDNRFDRDFQAAPAWEMRRVVRPEGPVPVEGPDGGGGDLMPRPLDLRVPPGKAVVAITGPNTGGKTVTLKAAGLMVLMAQAGLYLPCHPEALETHGSPRLAWFDRVLADIGDAQSLQQNLSTFSGHIRRIKQILSVVGGRSLVLLDEVGSGTDPLEGAALARAVLDRLAGQAYLTLATTHHAELKRASEEDPRFVNVSVAFDSVTLRPTYRLQWGTAGASNALDIATTLGFDWSVVLEARSLAKAMAESAEAASSPSPASSSSSSSPLSFSSAGRQSRLASVAASLVAQLEETRLEVEAQSQMRARRKEVQARVLATMDQVREVEAELKSSPKEIVLERDNLAAEVQAALDAFAAGQQPQAPVEEALKRIEALIPDQVAAFRRSGLPGAADAGLDDPDGLKPGDVVFVPAYGDMGDARVVSVKGNTVTVRMDANVMFRSGGNNRGRTIRVQRREIQKAGDKQAVFPAGWRSSYPSLADDIRRVLGEVSAEEQASAAAAAARREASRQAQDRKIAFGLDEDDEASYDALLQDDVASYDDLLGPAEEGGQDQLDDLLDYDDEKLGEDEEDEGDVREARSQAVPARRRKATAGAAGGRKGGVGGRGAAVAAATTGAEAGGAAPVGAPEQTRDNTLDLVGEVPELAVADLEDYLRSAPADTAFYVRHGMGTGAVRNAVYDVLTRRRGPKGRVRDWREVASSRGEVTIVWV